MNVHRTTGIYELHEGHGPAKNCYMIARVSECEKSFRVLELTVWNTGTEGEAWFDDYERKIIH